MLRSTCTNEGTSPAVVSFQKYLTEERCYHTGPGKAAPDLAHTHYASGSFRVLSVFEGTPRGWVDLKRQNILTKITGLKLNHVLGVTVTVTPTYSFPHRDLLF